MSSWTPGLEPSGALQRSHLAFTSPHSSPTGKQDCRPQLLLSAHPSCGHLVLCPALPRAHRVKTFWSFLFRFLSPLQLLRRAWSSLLLFPAAYLLVSGLRVRRWFSSSHF